MSSRSTQWTALGSSRASQAAIPVIRGNTVAANDIGLLICWSVGDGLAEGNTIAESRSHGILLGHRDTDNLVRDNTVLRSGKVGILFRDEPRSFAAHRNKVEGNRFVDSGPVGVVGNRRAGRDRGGDDRARRCIL